MEDSKFLPSEDLLEGVVYTGPDPRVVEETARRLEREHGIIFNRIPNTIYPGMPYTTTPDLADSRGIEYSQRHMNRMLDDPEEIEITADVVADRAILNPLVANKIVERQQISRAGKRPGRRVGSITGNPRERVHRNKPL